VVVLAENWPITDVFYYF